MLAALIAGAVYWGRGTIEVVSGPPRLGRRRCDILGPEGLPTFFVQDIPPVSSVGLRIARPELCAAGVPTPPACRQDTDHRNGANLS